MALTTAKIKLVLGHLPEAKQIHFIYKIIDYCLSPTQELWQNIYSVITVSGDTIWQSVLATNYDFPKSCKHSSDTGLPKWSMIPTIKDLNKAFEYSIQKHDKNVSRALKIELEGRHKALKELIGDFDNTPLDINMVYEGLRIQPVRQFTDSEKNIGLDLPLHSIGIDNYREEKIADWDYKRFFELAQKHGADTIDIFFWDGKLLVPCDGELFEYKIENLLANFYRSKIKKE